MKERDLLKAVAEYVIAEGSGKDIARARIRRMLEGWDHGPKKQQVEAIANQLLMELGCPWKMKGHDRLVCALTMVAQDPTLVHGITKGLYPDVANQFGETWQHTERNIRSVIEAIFERGNLRKIEQIYGESASKCKGKMTNKDFIIRTAQIIRQRAGIGV